ncbi:hypothetical protein GCM10023346_47830 [Arthrobacter gyeryongensis]|uniref:Uncharacterized protein n=1 Tax=Arthrobacter gyeryongensis TaxID=1650592 RepID=A0ABP9SVF1_9MICC
MTEVRRLGERIGLTGSYLLITELPAPAPYDLRRNAVYLILEFTKCKTNVSPDLAHSIMTAELTVPHFDFMIGLAECSPPLKAGSVLDVLAFAESITQAKYQG